MLANLEVSAEAIKEHPLFALDAIILWRYITEASVRNHCGYSCYLVALKMLSNPKQPYNSPTGYATSTFCRSIRRTATKIEDAEYVHHSIDRMART